MLYEILLEMQSQRDAQFQNVFDGFLSKCPTCKYMTTDEDVGDMLCEMNDCQTCLSTAIDLQIECIYECDAYKRRTR